MRVQGAGSTAMEWPHRWSGLTDGVCRARRDARVGFGGAGRIQTRCMTRRRRGKCGERRDETKCLARATCCASMVLCQRPWLHEPGLRTRAHPVAQQHRANVRLGWDDVRECGERQGHGKATVVKLAELRRGSAKRPDASEASRAGAQTLAPVNLPSPSPASPASPAGQHARWIAYVHGRVPESVLSSLEECQSATCKFKVTKKCRWLLSPCRLLLPLPDEKLRAGWPMRPSRRRSKPVSAFFQISPIPNRAQHTAAPPFHCCGRKSRIFLKKLDRGRLNKLERTQTSDLG